ncbi:hypothetical protein BDA99DRAFT_570166 [Phascolomyces articulosus]|uniref:Uncharacterized protein n=1 Tax=Phascolomyces articulosus TaxID=60185 RepID=A0AAD5PHR4_9FUNG|nr:hypothetical protein BDA99DRAFT_570166 [Phascolomyces articulosus]
MSPQTVKSDDTAESWYYSESDSSGDEKDDYPTLVRAHLKEYNMEKRKLRLTARRATKKQESKREGVIKAALYAAKAAQEAVKATVDLLDAINTYPPTQDAAKPPSTRARKHRKRTKVTSQPGDPLMFEIKTMPDYRKILPVPPQTSVKGKKSEVPKTTNYRSSDSLCTMGKTSGKASPVTIYIPSTPTSPGYEYENHASVVEDNKEPCNENNTLVRSLSHLSVEENQPGYLSARKKSIGNAIAPQSNKTSGEVLFSYGMPNDLGMRTWRSSKFLSNLEKAAQATLQETATQTASSPITTRKRSSEEPWDFDLVDTEG